MSSRLLVALAALALLGAGGVLLLRRGGGSTPRGDGTSPPTRDDRKHATPSVDPSALSWLDEPTLPARRVAGRVLYDGAPFAGAEVRLEGARDGATGRDPLRTRSDEQGAFDFGPIVAGQWSVIAEAPGLTGDSERVDLRDPRADPAPHLLTLELRACRAALFGTVRDASGGVVAGARVREPRGAAAISDAEGRYELCLEPGTMMVLAEADGYGAVMARASVLGRDRLDLSLVPESAISGIVVRATDGAPVADALVQATGADPEDGIAPRGAATDEQGAFRIAGVSAGRVRVTAVGDGFVSEDAVEVTVEAGGTISDLELRVTPTYDVSGRVVDGGEPVAGATVSGRRAGGGQSPADAVSQEDGSFRLRGLLPGTISLGVRDWDVVEPKQVTLPPRDLEGVTIEVDALASISGRVLARGKPVDGARVWAAGGGSTTSDRDGRYELAGLEPGEYEVSAESLAAGAYARGIPVRVAAREKKTGIDVTMDLVGSISGVVVEADGTPVAGVHVRFSLIEGRDFGFATTATDGTFTAGALSGGGEYDVDVRVRPGSAEPIPPAAGGVFPNIYVKDGTSRVTDVRLVVSLGKLEISGRVVSSKGTPLPDVKVQATVSDEDGGHRAHFPTWMDLPTAISDAEGGFTISGLLPGTYALLARAPGGSHATVTGIAAGARDVKIEMLEASGIDGTLVGFTGRVNVVAQGSHASDFREYEARITGDRFELRGLPAGTYVLGALGEEAADVQQVEVAAGEIAEVTMTSRGSARIDGRVVDARSGAGVAGASCSFLPSFREGERPLRGRRTGSNEPTEADGRFALPAPAGPGMLQCAGRGGATGWFHEVRPMVLVAGETRKLELRIVPLASDAEESDIGFVLEYGRSDGQAVVRFVEPDGPADEAGLRERDRLVTIDGIGLEGMGLSAVSSLLAFRPSGSRIELVVDRSGETSNITITTRTAND